MALTSIIKDFEVRSGLIVLGTSTVTTSTGNTSTLQVYGGAAIAKNLVVGGATDLWSAATIHNDLIVEQGSYLSGATSTGVISVTNNTQATTLGAGSIKTAGGAYVGINLVVNSSAESTGTLANNAMYVQGGVGIGGSLLVRGDAVFQKDVIFAGETTYVYSTNTVYTDNFIDLHVPGDSSLVWGVDDGKDIGLVFNYNSSGDKNGFLGINNGSKYLEWYSDGIPFEATGTFAGTTYGTFKTGSIVLQDSTQATNTFSGALTAQGGISSGGNIYGATLSGGNLTTSRVVIVGSNGQLTDDEGLTYNTVTNLLSVNVSASGSAENLEGGAVGSLPYQQSTGTTVFLPIGVAGLVLVSDGSKPIWATTGTIASGQAFTATNINFGDQYQIPYQTGFGQTTFSTNLEYDYNALTFRTLNAVFSATTVASSTATGAVQVYGGVGVGGSLWVGSDTYFLSDVEIRGGDLTTNQASFNLINSIASTVNIAGAATALTIGATSGYTEIRNNTNVTSVTEASATNTAALVVVGGVGIGKKLFVGGDTDIVGNVTATGSFTSTRANNTAEGAGQIYLNGATGNRIDFNNQGTAPPVFTTRSVGTKIVLYPALSGVSTDYALGVDSGILWSSIPGYDAGQFFKWYGGQTEIASLSGTGNLILAGAALVGASATIAGDLAVNGGNITTTATTFNLINTTATTVNFAGAGTAVTIGAATGYTEIRNQTTVTNSTNATSTATGALVVAGGVGINENLYVGGNANITGDVAVAGGDLTTNQAAFNLLNTNNTLLVNFAGSATQLIMGSAFGGFTQIRNQTTVTNITESTNVTSGAFQVRGGVGITKNTYIGGELHVSGATVLDRLRATVTTATELTVTGPTTISGITYLTNSTNAVATNDGALRVSGGVGIVKDVVVGGQITVGTTDAATTGSVVAAIFSNNMLLSSYTSPVITGSLQTSLDHWSFTTYRSCRYFVQIKDGSNVHISELSVFHDDVKAYVNEYGIATNNGQLGSFDADYSSGEVTIKFTPVSATAMTIKMVRMGITA
jgi:hypothetical protein